MRNQQRAVQGSRNTAAELQAMYESYSATAEAQRLARQIAHNEAVVELPRQRQEAKVKKTLKKSKKKSLEKVKEGVEMARKLKMRTVQQFLCDQCDEIIPLPKDGSIEGFIIQGNIYTADPAKRGGLIGNNIPEVPADEKIDPAEIKETVLCKECFIKALMPIGHNPYMSKKYRGVLEGLTEAGMSAMIAREPPHNRQWARGSVGAGPGPQEEYADDMADTVAESAGDMEMMGGAVGGAGRPLERPARRRRRMIPLEAMGAIASAAMGRPMMGGPPPIGQREEGLGGTNEGLMTAEAHNRRQRAQAEIDEHFRNAQNPYLGRSEGEYDNYGGPEQTT